MPVRGTHGAAGVIQAAGALLWRPGPDGPELALIHRPRYDDWSFPKGKLEPGEPHLLAAAREVLEETGHRMVVGRRLPPVAYEVNGMPKQVRYWAARAVPPGEGGGRFEPNDEVDRLAWLTPPEAGHRLTRWHDVNVLEAFLAAPVDTVPLLLLRHGAAEHRGPDYPDDMLRPLAPEGKAQAEALVPLISCYGPLSVIASPARRCLDTVNPYARSRQALVDVDPALTEPAHAADPQAVASWMRALISEARPAVVCSHRPVIDDMFASVLPPGLAADREEQRAAAIAPTVNGRDWTQKDTERYLEAGGRHARLPTGAAWVLHTTRRLSPRLLPRLVALDRLRP
ncbi:MAG TPA: NUDIX hydrolase [Actinocrinis sp.]|jgi:8-oxo-dGTP diphosphatase